MSEKRPPVVELYRQTVGRDWGRRTAITIYINFIHLIPSLLFWGRREGERKIWNDKRQERENDDNEKRYILNLLVYWWNQINK